MITIKNTTTKKVTLKGLSIVDGQVVDENEEVKDLSKIVKMIFNEGESFDFSLTSKKDDAEVIVDEDADESSGGDEQ